MNSTQIGGLIRTALAFLTGYLVSKGWVSSTIANDLIGLGSVLGVAVWSWYTNSTPAMVAAVAEAPEVKKVITTPGLAMAIPSIKVVSHEV